MMHMHIPLGVGEGDAVRIKGGLDVLMHVVVERPVIVVLRPDTHMEQHSIVTEAADTHKGCRLVRCKGVRFDESEDQGLGSLGIVIVGNADLKIEPPHGLCGVVHNHSIGDLAVGDIDGGVIAEDELGLEDADLLDSTGDVIELHKIADLEGLGEHDPEAACDVRKAVLQGKADGKSRCTDDGDDGRHGDVEHSEDDDGNEYVESHADEGFEKACCGGVNIAFFEGTLDKAHQDLDECHADDKDERRHEERGEQCFEECKQPCKHLGDGLGVIRDDGFEDVFGRFLHEIVSFRIYHYSAGGGFCQLLRMHAGGIACPLYRIYTISAKNNKKSRKKDLQKIRFYSIIDLYAEFSRTECAYMNDMLFPNMLLPMAGGSIPGPDELTQSQMWGVTLAGVGIVFACLVLLVFVIWAFGKIFDSINQSKKAKEAAAAAKSAPKAAAPKAPAKPAPAPAPAPAAPAEDEDEVIAVISAVIAAMSAEDGKVYKVRSVKPAGTSGFGGRAAWAMDGRRQNVMPF